MAGKPAVKDLGGLDAAARAIEAMGGPGRAAQLLNESDPHGRQLTAATVSRWAKTGVPASWCPTVHQLTGIPLTQLDPVVYPPALVGEAR